MFHVAYVCLKAVAGLAGVGMTYAALFLYEDEEGHVTNRLEQWWTVLDDTQKLSLSKHSVFMKEVSRLAGAIFDMFFGKRLFSYEAFFTSTFFSMGTSIILASTVLPESQT